MVVKFADTQKEKDQKRIHQATSNLWGLGGLGGINSLTPPYLTVNTFLEALVVLFFLNVPVFGAQGLPTNGTSGLQQLGGLNALGVQQLLAASTPTSLASTQGAHLELEFSSGPCFLSEWFYFFVFLFETQPPCRAWRTFRRRRASH